MPLPRPVSSADMRSAHASGSLPASPAPRGAGSSSNSAQLGLKLAVERGAYVAGQQVKGVLELSVKGQLALGEVGIEFLGVEELRSRDHTSTRRLLSDRVDFQGNGLPPSNAVKPGTKPIQGSFYPALPGRTRFAFAFTIPASLPSTCALGSNAQTRYELRAFASSLVDGSVDLRSEKLDVRVVERWGDWRDDEWQTPLERTAQGTLARGGDGALELVASVGKGEWALRPPRLFWRSDGDMDVAGKGKVEVRAHVRNLSKRHVTGLKLSLIRRLRVLYPQDARPVVEPPVVSSVVVAERFHGIDYDVRSGGERDAVLALQVPTDECWTVRKGTLFELDVVLRVEVECGFLQKPLSVDLPIWIAHPLSLPNSAHRFADEERARLAPAAAPVQAPALAPTPSPQPSIPYSPSTVGTFSSPAAPYHTLSPEPYAPAFAHGGHLPLPGTPAPGQHGRHYAASAISMTSSASSPAMYPPSTPTPYFPPPPAAPAELYDPVPAAYAAPHGYVAFDPTVPDLSTSQFLGSLQHQQPGYVPTPPGTAFSPPPPQAQHAPLAPWSVAAPPSPQPHVASVPPPHGPPPPPSRAHTIAAGLGLAPHEAAQVEVNLAPLEPYSAAQRAHQHARTASDLPYLAQQQQQRGVEPVRQHSAPAAAAAHVHGGELDLPDASPPRPCASPVPAIRGGEVRSPEPVTSSAPSRTRVSHTPPPPSPSSHFRRAEQSRSPSPVESAPASASAHSSPLGAASPASASAAAPTSALLETIGEDGESQAGNTARSAMLPPGLADALRDDGGAGTTAGSSPGRSSVQDLEELVEEEERRDVERRARTKEGSRAADLPPMPFPTTAATASRDARPRAQDIFAPVVAVPSSAPTAPSPASSSSPTRLAAPKRDGGGLSALEARLARPSTPDLSALQLCSPSRSPSPIKPLGSPAPHARAFAPHLDLLHLGGESETVGSALRARSISRASKHEEERRRAVEEDPKEAVRRAVAGAAWAKGPSARSAEAAAPVGGLAQKEELPVKASVADWVKSVEPVAPASVEQPVRPVVEQVADVCAAKAGRPAQYKPRAPLKLAAPVAEPAMQEPSSPSSPRRPLPSPPPSPRRALPSPPAQDTSPSKPTSPSFGVSAPVAVPEQPPASAKPNVPRPVFGASPSKRDISPAPSPDKPPSPSLPVPAARSPTKTSLPSPWSSRPSPWSSVGRSPSPVKAASPAPTSTPSFDAPKSPIAAVVDDGGRKAVDVVEIKGLKREAVDRVAGWLQKADTEPVAPAPAPDSVVSLQTKQQKRITIEFGRHAPEPPSRPSSSSSRTGLSRSAAAPPSLHATGRPQQQQQEPTVAQLLAAETRAAMRQAQADAPADLTRSSAVEKGLNGYLAALKSDAEDVGKGEQAHRSARRAAPGKVRSVASIWAERVEEADRERTESPPPPAARALGHKPTKSHSSIQLGALSSSTSSPRPLASLSNSPVAPTAGPLPSRRARPVSLQPSASPARPFLNSTVGRASPSSSAAAAASSPTAGMRVPSAAGGAIKGAGKLAASESAPAGWASPSRAGAADRSGSGAKVKDLLARYQQQLA
ncbi:hypothetical protein JCM3775_002609 [Rhodotorula graminis]